MINLNFSHNIYWAGLLPVMFLAIFSSISSGQNSRKAEYQFFMIGHAHIDPVWRWTKDEGYQEVFATFRSALDRMTEFPDVCFVASSAQFYDWIAEADPAMFEEIKVRVQEGRWNIVGGWWIEPDVNCPSGESLVRQGLYGQRFFQEKFGRKARVGFNPDTFGHPWTLPQILKLQGLEAYFFLRPGKHEKPGLPAPIFYWQAPDGSKILTVQIISSYNGGGDFLSKRVNDYTSRFEQELPQVKDYAIFYGVGNHGGGPTIAAIKNIQQACKDQYPGMQFSTPEKYIDLLRSNSINFPEVKDELQHHARGCYSACAAIKMWNRQAENALVTAEKISVFTSVLLDKPYPAEALRLSWKKVLFNQFHDILAGSSLEQGYMDARDDYGYALAVAKDATTAALHHLAANVETEDLRFPKSTPFIIFNPCSWTVSTPTEIEMQRLDRHVKPVLRDSEGLPVPYQEIRTAGAKVRSRIRIVFQPKLPGSGYHTYRLDFGANDNQKTDSGVKVAKWVLENELVRITFDGKNGTISSYFDKKNQRELFRKAGAEAIVLDDWDDTWGHKIVAYDKEIGRFAGATLRIMEEGPERGRIQVKSYYNDSFIIQDFALHRNSMDLDCRVTVNWHERYRVLKIGFSTVLTGGKLTYSIPYGFIEREMNGHEEPGQEWIDVSGTDPQGAFGIALINDSKCSYSVNDGDIRLTIFHSTAWSHHDPEVVTEDDGYRYMEQGIHEFSYQLVPHQGDWRQGDISHKARAYLTPPKTLLTTNHNGNMAKTASWLAVNIPNVSITAAKMAENAAAVVLRCVELHGTAARCTIDISSLGRTIDINLRPCEIKTLFVPLASNLPIKEVNVLEE